MKILIPPSEGKAKTKPTKVLFSDTNFKFEHHVKQVVRLLSLIDDEGLSSVYGTSEEKAMIEAIGELIVDISIWLVLGLVCMKLTAFTWRRIYHFTKDM